MIGLKKNLRITQRNPSVKVQIKKTNWKVKHEEFKKMSKRAMDENYPLGNSILKKNIQPFNIYDNKN
jgi:hypothetical protein